MTTTNYKVNDSGARGKLFEIAIHKLLNRKNCAIRTSGKCDEIIARKHYEIKTGAGELGNVGAKMVKGASMVIYCPIVILDENGTVDLTKQEGFVLSRENFLTALENAGALRTKTATNGTEKTTIQTFWNNAKNAPHGKLYERILDEMYENCDETLEEWLEERG